MVVSVAEPRWPGLACCFWQPAEAPRSLPRGQDAAAQGRSHCQRRGRRSGVATRPCQERGACRGHSAGALAVHTRPVDPVQRQRAEGRKQTCGEDTGHGLPRRRFAPVETRPSRSCDELRERRCRAAPRTACPLFGLNVETPAPGFLGAGQRRRPEGNPARAAVPLPAIDIATMSRGPDPHDEASMTGVPDRVLPRRRRQPGHVGVAQTLPLHGHGSTLQNGADGVGRLVHHGFGQMRVFQRRCRIAVSQKPMVSTVSPRASAMLAYVCRQS